MKQNIINFPFEKTKEFREIEQQLQAENDYDKAYIEQFAYNGIVTALANVYDAGFDMEDATTLEITALIGRLHKMIANHQRGIIDPLMPFTKKLIKDLNLSKVHLLKD